MRASVLLFVAALAVRAAAAAVFPDPAYPDSLYYVNVAQRLAAGQGFSIDYVWNFVDVGGRLPAEPGLPIPSNAHWMPLASLIQVPFILLLGAGPLAYGLPFWLIGALAAPLTWRIGLDAGIGRLAAGAAGALVVAPLALAPFLAQPDNFALYMTLGALALWCCARGLRGDRRAFVLGGVVVGLATLSRNDGVLLGVPFALAFLLERRRAWRGDAGVDARIGWAAAIACGLGFLLVVAPWYARQLAVFGSLSPSAASGRILWITEYGQLFSISGETTLATFLAQGPAALLASRVAGLVDALKWFAVAPLLVYLVPFTLLGAWDRRRDPAFTPWITYGLLLFAFSALVSAVHVDHGTFLHSAVALAPHAYLAAAVGIGVAVRGAARRLRHWDVPRATRNFTLAAVVVAVIGTVGATLRVGGSWRAEVAVRTPIVAHLRTVPATDRVMSPDPGAYRYLAGTGGIVTPNDPLEVVERALRAYGVRWLVIERAYLLAPYQPLLTGEARPAWVSDPVVTVEGPASPGPGSTTPAAVLLAVCFEPADARCDR